MSLTFEWEHFLFLSLSLSLSSSLFLSLSLPLSLALSGWRGEQQLVSAAEGRRSAGHPGIPERPAVLYGAGPCPAPLPGPVQRTAPIG